MRDDEKAAQVLAHQDGESGQLCFGEVRLPETDSITDYTPTQGAISALLLHGRANAITAREIARMAGKTIREVTRAICAERRAGAPILSDPGVGFWLADSLDELRRCAAALHRRAGEINATARALEQIVRGRV